MTDEVSTRLAQLIRDVVGRPDLDVVDELTAADVDGWDSVAHVELIYAIEEEFGIEFPAEEISSHPDVGALRRDVLQRLRGS